MGSRLLAAVLLAGCSHVVSDAMHPDAAPGADDTAAADAAGPACLTLPLRAIDDDDNDTIADDVDNCFGIAGAVGDGDHDGIGDLCDAWSSQDERFCMWTFRDASAGEDPQTWSLAWGPSPSWSVSASALSHVAAETESVESTGPFVTGAGGVAVEAHIAVDGYALPFVAGIELPLQDGSATFGCRVRQSTATAMTSLDLMRAGVALGAGSLGMTLPMQAEWNLRIALIHENGKLQVACYVLGSTVPAVGFIKEFADAPVQVRPRVFAGNGTFRFHHVVLTRLGL